MALAPCSLRAPMRAFALAELGQDTQIIYECLNDKQRRKPEAIPYCQATVIR